MSEWERSGPLFPALLVEKKEVRLNCDTRCHDQRRRGSSWRRGVRSTQHVFARDSEDERPSSWWRNGILYHDLALRSSTRALQGGLAVFSIFLEEFAQVHLASTGSMRLLKKLLLKADAAKLNAAQLTRVEPKNSWVFTTRPSARISVMFKRV
jgi:hypothetical protein